MGLDDVIAAKEEGAAESTLAPLGDDRHHDDVRVGFFSQGLQRGGIIELPFIGSTVQLAIVRIAENGIHFLIHIRRRLAAGAVKRREQQHRAGILKVPQLPIHRFLILRFAGKRQDAKERNKK